MAALWRYRARCVEVTDGDTVKVVVDHGMNIQSMQAVRVLGVDSPEMNTAAGRSAKAFTAAWVKAHVHGDEHWPITITTERDKRSFNRYVARIVCEDGHDLAADLIAAAHGATR